MQKYISDIIKINGFIALDEFISSSLCHPVYGYYTKQNPIKKDFITSPEISNAFGVIIASFFFDKILNNNNAKNIDEIHLIEFGGGSGKLALDILNFLINLKKINNKQINSLIEKINFHSIEFSETLKLIQRNKLGNIPEIKKHFWGNISEFSAFLKINNNHEQLNNNFLVFIANEFFDALPIKQFFFDGNEFSEIIITEKDGLFNFEKIKINSEKLKLIPGNSQKIENSIFEIPIVGIKIMENIAELMKNSQSILLTFDYGFFKKNKYTSTLQGIFNGKKNSNILENVGDSDITHLVNFETLQSVLTQNGIKTQITTQKNFLEQNGILNLITPENEHGIQRMISENEMGSLFKVLIAES